MKNTLRYIFALFLILIASDAIMAQSAAPNEKLRSPRSTVRYFLKIMNKVEYEKAPRIDEAALALYLEDIPEAGRVAAGRDMAAKLFKVLYSYTFKVEALPDEIKDNTYTLPIGSEKGMDFSLRRYDNGEWKFNYTKTLCHLDEYLSVIVKEEENKGFDDTVDPVFRSPRETLRYFFSNMSKETRAGDEAAAEALDLTGYERSIRKEIGRERAVLLNSVLARYRYIDLVELSDDSKATPVIILNDAIGRITIEKVKVEDSNLMAWKFSASSVKALPILYDAYKEKEVLSDINSLEKLPLNIRVRDYMKKNFPSLMKSTFLLENWQWIGLFVIVFIGLGMGKFVIYIITKAIKTVFQKARIEIIEDTQKKFLVPISIAITAIIWWSGIYILGLPSSARVILLVSVKVVAALSAVWAGYRLVDLIGNYLIGKAEQTENKFDDILAPLITKAMKVMVVICGLVFLADIFAIDIDKFMAGLGLGGLAFALAAKDTISNVFGSVTILMDRPFQIGDWVTIGKADGVVESVGIRSTRIRTFYDSIITIPNSELINAQIDNYGARRYRRIETTINIGLDTPPEKIDAFCEGIRELIRNHPCTRKDYYIINLDKLGPYAMGILVYCFVITPDWIAELREKHRLLNDIIRLAKKLGIEFVPPTQTIYTRPSTALEYSKIPESEAAAKKEGIRLADDIMHESGILKDIKPNV